MTEKPLERLNYVNGSPLDAEAFKAEQEYHIRTRRWLNKSLYSAGIARGLEVRKFPDDTPNVIVTSGLALDSEGREIILMEEIQLEVCASVGSSPNSPNGNYLVVEYTEELIAFQSGNCAVRTPASNPAKSSANWGGPTRIQSQVKFSWVRFVPPPGTNQVVLAWVELDANCRKIVLIDSGIRRYIGRASEALVKQYVLEGERLIANVRTMASAQYQTTAKVYFHIRGRTPNSITLYLKASEFPKIHYTEMGQHDHHGSSIGVTFTSKTITAAQLAHTHSLDGKYTGNDAVASNDPSPHSHGFDAWVNTDVMTSSDWGIAFGGRTLDAYQHTKRISEVWAVPAVGNPTIIVTPRDAAEIEITGGQHIHSLTGDTGAAVFTGTGAGIDITPTVASSSSTLAPSGVNDHTPEKFYSARNGAPLTYFDDLRIAIDGVDRTALIIEQIIDSVADQTQKDAWKQKLGDGTGSHPLVEETIDAVPIRLNFLPQVRFVEGQHVIEFSLPPNSEANGGKLYYNLYIE